MTVSGAAGAPSSGRRPFGRQRAADQGLAIACGRLLEGQGETLLVIVEHQQARADEVDASRREPSAEQRRAAHADGGERGLRDDRAVLVDQPDVAQAKQHAGPVGGARENRVVDLDVHVGELAVDRVLDGRHQARQRDGTAGKPAIAQHDGDQAYDQNSGEDFAADAGAARRELGELDLDRRGHPLHQRPAPLRQRKKRLATFGERLATSSGQFRERTCDRLVHSVTGPRQGSSTRARRPP